MTIHETLKNYLGSQLQAVTGGVFEVSVPFDSRDQVFFKALFCNSYLPKGKRPFKSERFMLYTDKQDASALYDVESGEEPEDEDDTDHNRPGEDF